MQRLALLNRVKGGRPERQLSREAAVPNFGEWRVIKKTFRGLSGWPMFGTAAV